MPTCLFGQKDYQQQLVLRHMVRDLNLAVKLVTCPIIRESSGLALSRAIVIYQRQKPKRSRAFKSFASSRTTVAPMVKHCGDVLRKLLHTTLTEQGSTASITPPWCMPIRCRNWNQLTRPPWH